MGHKHHKMKLERAKRGTFRIFWRLMRDYAFRYPGYLTVGVLSAVIMGGSLGVAFRMMSTSVDLFEAGTAGTVPTAMVTTQNVTDEANPLGAGTSSSQSADTTELQSRAERHKEKSNKLLVHVNRILTTLHMEPVNEGSVFVRITSTYLFVVADYFGACVLDKSG